MGDGTGGGVALVTLPPAAMAELQRIIRSSEGLVSGSYRPFLYRMIKDVHPDMNRELWQEIAGVRPDVSRDAAEARRAERQRQADVDLLRQHGVAPCCAQCDRDQVARLRALPESVPTDPDEDEESPERTCACRDCDDSACQGECHPCEYHGCSQCHPDGCPEDDLYGCCGYCEECQRHPNGPNGDDVCSMNHCHDCDHNCERD